MKEFINFDRLRKSWTTFSTLGLCLITCTNEQPTRMIDSYMYKTAVHNANLTFSGSLKCSLNILKPVPYKTTAKTPAKGWHGIVSPNCCERIEETNNCASLNFEDLRPMRRGMNWKNSVLIKYSSYLQLLMDSGCRVLTPRHWFLYWFDRSHSSSQKTPLKRHQKLLGWAFFSRYFEIIPLFSALIVSCWQFPWPMSLTVVTSSVKILNLHIKCLQRRARFQL